MLRLAPRLTMALLALPVLAGLAGTVMPAFAPQNGESLAAFGALARWPGFIVAVKLSFCTGILSTAISLAITLLIVAALRGSRAFSILQHLLSPLLAVPHAAAALGLAFLIAPSGWIVRIISPEITGWTAPPDLLILNDPWGAALIFGLVAKEVPFLLLMALAALPQTEAARRMLVATALGYGRVWGFAICVLPGLYRQLRLAVYAVLAYAMTCVDMAVILGPSLPPPLSVQISHWMMEPSLTMRGTAAVGAFVQLLAVLVAVIGWHAAERLARATLIWCADQGWRCAGADWLMQVFAKGAGGILAFVLFAGLTSLALWSFAGLWQFPNAVPQGLTLKTWIAAGPDLAQTGLVTAWLGLVSAGGALLLVLACLEAEHRFDLSAGTSAIWLLYLPLLVPQIAILPGLQVFALRLFGSDHLLLAVAAIHMIFVMPYVFLSLAPAYRAWDIRQAVIGATLGASPSSVFWRLRLPMLLPAILTASAVGLAVSVSQYLPTLLIGGGRVETLTTQAVALSSGGNRRIVGAYALMQMLLPALGFALAIGLPRLIFANRRGVLQQAHL